VYGSVIESNASTLRGRLEDAHLELELGDDRIEELENLEFWYRIVDKIAESTTDWKSLKIRLGSSHISSRKARMGQVERTTCSKDLCNEERHDIEMECRLTVSTASCQIFHPYPSSRLVSHL
jgi:hypothetical protein